MYQVTEIRTYWVLADSADEAEVLVKDGQADPDEITFEVNR